MDLAARKRPQTRVSEAVIETNSSLTRRLTIAYVTGLMFIAILSGTVHVLLDRVIAQQHDAGTVINIAGRQRMLSQRIALLANEIRRGDPNAPGQLRDAISLMGRSQDALVHGDAMGIARPLSPEAHAYYFDGPDALDPAVRQFLRTASAFADDPADEAAFRDLERQALVTLLPLLDGAVSRFERESNERIEWLSLAQKVVLSTLLMTLLMEALLIFRPLVLKVQEHSQSLYDLAHLDELTGLANRRSFIAQAARELKSAIAGKESVAVILLDLDHFKRINDDFGHAAGDAVLQRFASIAKRNLRKTEIMGRVGGEEFAVLISPADLPTGILVAEKLRRVVAEDEGSDTPPFTVSIGVAALKPGDASVDDLMRRADHWLYEAKRGGRNRVAASGIDPAAAV